jgi:hypothetical protein
MDDDFERGFDAQHPNVQDGLTGTLSDETAPVVSAMSARAGSISRMRAMYLEKSRTTATLQHCPARLVPVPRGSTGAPYRRHVATAAITSPASSGMTRPIGTCR